MSSETYRGFIIEVRTPGDSDAWRALVNAEKHTDVVIDNKLMGATFASPTVAVSKMFESEAKANEAGLVHGREIVDSRLDISTAEATNSEERR